jgi:hypothetical protein
VTAAAAALVAALAAAALPAEPLATIGIPGTRIELPLPAGFALSEQFAGIVHDATGASVVVSEVPRPLPVMREALTEERLAAGGLVLHESKELELDGTDATLVYASQVSQGVGYRKWLLVFGDAERTVSLVASVEARHEEAMRDVLVACLRGVRWDPSRPVDSFAGLGFHVTETPALVVTERVSTMLFLTRPRAEGPIAPGDPLFIVGTTGRPDPLPELDALARDNVRSIREVRDVSFESETPLELDGMAAFETVARGFDAETGEPVVVYQALALDGEERVVLMQGIVGADRAERYLPEFRAVAASFARDPGDGP